MDRRCKDLKELTVQKEQELQSLREHHANQLEEALKGVFLLFYKGL